MTVIIKLRGLPWSASTKEVREFFQGLSLVEEDIHLAPKKNGKASGIAFAVFHSDEDARKGMFRTRKYIGKRYVELALSSVAEMEKYLNEGVPESRKELADRRESYTADVRGRNGNYGTVDRIGDRENGFSKRSRSRSPLNRHRGFGDGDRLSLKYESRRLAGTGHRLSERGNNERDRSRYVERKESSWDNGADKGNRNGEERQRDARRRDKHRSSGEPKDSEGPLTCVRMIGLPFDVREEDVKIFFEGLKILGIHFLRHKSGTFAGRPNGWGYVEFRSLGDCIHAESRNKQFIGKRYVEVKRCTREQMNWEINCSATNREEGPPELMSLTEQRGHERNDSFGPDQAMNLLSAGVDSFAGCQPISVGINSMMMQLAAGANVNANDIRSSCVVGIRNLPSSTTAEEILDFFYGFPVAPDSIRIHYLAPGRSSGDAMITLHTASDAMNAIEQLNHKPVGKRNVQLFLI